MKSSMIGIPFARLMPVHPPGRGVVKAALLLIACLLTLMDQNTALADQRTLSSEDISAAFGNRSPADADVNAWRDEVEDISEAKPQQQFRFSLPFGRDPFALPADLFSDTTAPAAASVPGSKRLVSSAYQLKGTWRQLGGAWQAILQDVSGEPIVVTAGDKVGDAEVLVITDSELTLRWLDITLEGKAQFRRLTLSL